VRAAAALVAITTALAAGGCGGPKDWDDFRRQLDQRWCARQVHCGAVASGDTTRCGVPDPLIALSPATFDVGGAIRRGSMQFQTMDAQSCLDAVKDAPCDPTQAAIPLGRYCHGVATAQLPAGKACLDSVECQGGACVAPAASCAGQCIGWVPTNGACDPQSARGDPAHECDPTVHYCDPTGVCRKKKQPGESCLGDSECAFYFFCVGGKCSDPAQIDEGKSCSATSGPPCRAGLFCDGAHCVRDKAKGQPCGADGQCADGLGCAGGTCAGWLDTGASCSLASDGKSSACPATTACTAGSCQRTGQIVLGPEQLCMSTPTACAPGLVCLDNVCTYLAGVGGACRADAQCSAGLRCDSATTSCAAVSCSAAP
jgi:hypothetical protein